MKKCDCVQNKNISLDTNKPEEVLKMEVGTCLSSSKEVTVTPAALEVLHKITEGGRGLKGNDRGNWGI